MAIPFKSLRFSESKNQVWGVNFVRYISRMKETDYWTTIGRNDILLQKSGLLQGFENIKPGRNIEFFPYAGYRHSVWDRE